MSTLSPMHAGYIAGRYRDGSWSDHWTDVHRCAAATFTACRPACRCGWVGPARPADAAGYAVATDAAAEHGEAAASQPAAPRCRPLPLPVLRLAPAL